MKAIGIILLVIGLAGVVVFGIQAMNDSESFSLFGLDVAVSKANWTPLIISAIITVFGLFLALVKKRG